MRMRHILSSVGSPGLQYFPHYLINATMFENAVKQNMCFNVLYHFERFLILKRVDRDLIKMYVDVHVKHTLFLSDFNKS
jgi:hypothetical protein